MTKSKGLFFLIAIVCMALSCERNKLDKKYWDNPFPPYTQKVELIKINSKTFVLDSLTSLAYPIIQYVPKYNILVGFSSFNNTLVIYDYKTSAIRQKIGLSDDKEKGVGNFHTAFTYNFYFINYDSIVIFNQSEEKVFLVDSSARVLRSFSVKPTDKSHFPPRANLTDLMHYADGEVYLYSGPGRNIYNPRAPFLSNLMLLLNLKTGKTRTILKYPDQYSKATWGEHLYDFYTTYNSNEGKFVVSFPNDHYIYVLSHGSKPLQFYSGGDSVLHVNPFSFSTSNTKPNEDDIEKELNNLRIQRYYHRIFYDQFNNVYYRFVSPALKDFDKNLGTQFSIIILDKNFNKIGEQNFKREDYTQLSTFISSEGLCLLRDGDTEDKLEYDIYKLTVN